MLFNRTDNLLSTSQNLLQHSAFLRESPGELRITLLQCDSTRPLQNDNPMTAVVSNEMPPQHPSTSCGCLDTFTVSARLFYAVRNCVTKTEVFALC